jgi:hypothetical protein
LLHSTHFSTIIKNKVARSVKHNNIRSDIGSAKHTTMLWKKGKERGAK